MAPAEPPSSSVTLAQALEAAQRGDARLAHEICVHLTQQDPRNEEAWLWRARTAESPEETIAALSRTLTLYPSHGLARRFLHSAMTWLLQRDAFLAYVTETDGFYVVRTSSDLRFAHPKDRAAPKPFPPTHPPPSRAAFRWLAWSVIGLLPAGLGTLLCAPLAALAALKLLRHSEGPDRQRALVVLWGAVALWLLALGLAAILILHIW